MLSSKTTASTQQLISKSYSSIKQTKNLQRSQFIKKERFLFGK
jgi:hypothetical protein